ISGPMFPAHEQKAAPTEEKDADMFRHHALEATEKAQQGHGSQCHPEGTVHGGGPSGNPVGHQGGPCNDQGADEPDGDKTLSKDIDDPRKEQEGDRRLEVPKFGVGEMALHPGLSYEDKGALVPVDIVSEEKGKADQQGDEQ